MAGTGSGGRTPKKPSPQNGKTKSFSTVNYRDARLAKERQRRQYEQQKKEKIIFALFVVIIIALILIAILVFKKAIDNGEAADSQTDAETPTTSPDETTDPEDLQNLSHFLKEMCGKDMIHKGDLIFVDSTHSFSSIGELAEIYSGRTKFQKGEKTVYSYYLPDTTPKLSAVALDALNKMADDFYELTGNNDLYVDKAYDVSAINDHTTGLAFDLSVYTIEHLHYPLDDKAVSSDFEWIFENYYKYGFVIETPEQSGERYYHFRYVGIPAATYMFKNNVGLSDFLKLLRDEHAFEDGKTNALSVKTDDGGNYEMYYVEATGGDMTSVPVPENALFFSISGDNMNGFVVTVRMS